MARRRPIRRKGGPARGRKRMARGGVARGRTRRKMQQGGHTHQTRPYAHNHHRAMYHHHSLPGGGQTLNNTFAQYVHDGSGPVYGGPGQSEASDQVLYGNYDEDGLFIQTPWPYIHNREYQPSSEAGAHSGHNLTPIRARRGSMRKGGRVRNRMQRGGRVRNRMQRGGRVRNTRRMAHGGYHPPNGNNRGGNIIRSGNKEYRCPGGGMTITADCVEIIRPNLSF